MNVGILLDLKIHSRMPHKGIIFVSEFDKYISKPTQTWKNFTEQDVKRVQKFSFIDYIPFDCWPSSTATLFSDATYFRSPSGMLTLLSPLFCWRRRKKGSLMRLAANLVPLFSGPVDTRGRAKTKKVLIFIRFI